MSNTEITIRAIQPSEWPRYTERGSRIMGVNTPSPYTTQAIVAETDGEPAAYFFLGQILYGRNLYVYRKFRGLNIPERMNQFLDENLTPGTEYFTLFANPMLWERAKAQGFRELPGKFMSRVSGVKDAV